MRIDGHGKHLCCAAVNPACACASACACGDPVVWCKRYEGALVSTVGRGRQSAYLRRRQARLQNVLRVLGWVGFISLPCPGGALDIIVD